MSPVDNTLTEGSEADYELEQRAFAWANSNIDHRAKDLIKDLWRAYCEASSPAMRASIGDAVSDEMVEAAQKALPDHAFIERSLIVEMLTAALEVLPVCSLAPQLDK